jgi:hypothetical protein
MPADELRPGDERPTELFGPDASEIPNCPEPDPSPLSTLFVRVRTTAAGGNFRPRNVGAVWIERAGGGFVKTLARWGQIRAKWLTRFAAASQNNLVDAITGPTQLSHTTHELTWDLRDLASCEVPTDTYQILIEMTDGNLTGPSYAVEVTKDQTPLTLTPPDQPNFHELLVELR